MEITMILLEVKELDLFTVNLSQEAREAILIIFLYIAMGMWYLKLVWEMILSKWGEKSCFTYKYARWK